MLKSINESVNFLRKKGITEPQVGIILGSGLGKLVNEIKIEKSINYEDIPNFPISTVEFHKGKLIYGELKGKKVIAMQGRFHYYEGYSLNEITFPVRVMKFLGIKSILISNAGGAMNLNFKKGSLMLLDDHINMIPDSPLRGKEYREFGSRFVDLSQPYSKTLNEKLLAIAKEKNIVLHKGIYVAVPGPQLETRAEYRFLRSTGADVVGMSTVPEAIVAKQMGLSCAAISVLTDECDPDNLKEVDISEILETAGKAEVGLIELFVSLIEEL